MIYKSLKMEQIADLKTKELYHEMIQAIKETDLNCFKDMRNLLFDRELGTNILTEFVTSEPSDFERLHTILIEVKQQLAPIIGSEIVHNLANVPDR